MKSTATGERENFANDFPTAGFNRSQAGFQILGIENYERFVRSRSGVCLKATSQPSVLKTGIGRALVGEFPAKHRTVEMFSCTCFGNWKFEVVNLVVAVVVVVLVHKSYLDAFW